MSHEARLAALEEEHLETLVDSIRVSLRRAQIGYTNLAARGGVVSVEIRDPAQDHPQGNAGPPPLRHSVPIGV